MSSSGSRWWLVLSLAGLACGGAGFEAPAVGPVVLVDGGGTEDAGGGADDAGGGADDAGGGADDAGGADAGVMGGDAGQRPDAGAGVVTFDAGGLVNDVCGNGWVSPSGLRLPQDIRAAAANTRLRGGTDRLEVYSGGAGAGLSDAEVERFFHSSCGALRFVFQELGESAVAAEYRPAVRIVVLDDAAYATATGAPGTYGVSFPADGAASDAVALPASGFGNLPELDDTLAHELVHIVQGRAAPDNANYTWYMIEGQAISAGTRYGRQRHGYPTGFAKGWLDRATGADATTTFARYGIDDLTQNLAQVGQDQSLSGFFVEYLRVRATNGTGVGFVDAQHRMLNVMRAVSGGASLSSAWVAQYPGLPLSAAQSGYTTFLTSTAGNLAQRYQGTVFE
jgi:hypothetical protein